MQIKGLGQAIRKLAKGKHYVARREIAGYTTGKALDRWSAYTSGIGWALDLATPEEALAALEEKGRKKGD